MLYAQRTHRNNINRGVGRIIVSGRFFFTLAQRRITLSHRIFFSCSRSKPCGYSKLEASMKVPLSLLSLVLAGAVFAAMPAGAKQATAETKQAPAAKKETKWQGHGVRIYKDLSQMYMPG